VIAARKALSEQRRRALRAVLRERELSPAEWARMAGLPNANTLYNFMNGHTDLLSDATLKALARAIPGASVSEILGETPPRVAKLRLVACRTEARLGGWRPSYETMMPTTVELPMPDGVDADEVVRIVDGHADQLYPAGTYVAITSFASLARPLRGGDRVLLHRVQNGRHETTVRELVVKDGVAELLLRSGRAEPAPIAVPWPYDGRQWSEGADRFQLRGRVAMSVQIGDQFPA
jgi:hypothetical protein